MIPNSINNKLLRQIRRRELEKKINAGKILPSDTELGYIYVFNLPSCPGYFKIGMTKQVPRDRVSQQEYACKLPYNLVEDPQDKPFRGYSAVEKLIMAELHNLRRKFFCGNCKTHKQMAREHGEWYEISEEKALEVVERWRKWMVKGKPFDNNGVLTPFWVRKYEGAIQDTANVRWEEWLCPPIPLPPYHHYLSFVITGGKVLSAALCAFMVNPREQGKRDSRFGALYNKGTPTDWLKFLGLCSLLWVWMGKLGILIGVIAVVLFHI